MVKNVSLLPGDMLYLPQGVPHYARSSGASSLHVTMSIYRKHFTVASLLAAWLELGPVEGLFDVSFATRIDATQARLMRNMEAAPLPASISLPLLRAFDGLDIPQHVARRAMDETLLYGQQVAQSQEDSRLEALLQAPKLESFIAAWPLCSLEQAEAALMAARQLRWPLGSQTERVEC